MQALIVVCLCNVLWRECPTPAANQVSKVPVYEPPVRRDQEKEYAGVMMWSLLCVSALLQSSGIARKARGGEGDVHCTCRVVVV